MNLNEMASQAPLFIKNTVAIFSGPKRFISALRLESSDALRSALIYYALAIAVSLALELPFVGQTGGFSDQLPTVVLFFTVGILLSNVLITLALYVVGGRSGYRNNLVVTCYIWGMSALIWSTGALMSKGVVIIQEPSLLPQYLEYMQLLLAKSEAIKDPQFEVIGQSVGVLQAILVFAAFLVVLMVWFLFSWAGYRSINILSGQRSIVALIIFLICLYPLTKIMSAIQHAIGLMLF
jgi:hypothetical protein